MSGFNKSGIVPFEFMVLIKPKAVAEKTTGGVFLPDDKRDREQYATGEGTLIATSDAAFSYHDWASDSCPRIGDVVIYRSYAGLIVEGSDGVKYRLMSDKEIAAFRRADVAREVAA